MEAERDNNIPTALRGELALRGFEDREFNFQLLRSLGVVSYGGGSVGEILSLVPKIESDDPVSWVNQFKELAENTKKAALSLMKKGNMRSAKETFVRASSYFRAAEYYGDPRDSKTRFLGMESRDCFINAFRLDRYEFQALRIPYKEDFIPAYWMAPPGGKLKRVVMMMSGFDGTSEEMYFQAGAAALERGYSVLLFDGPGQVGMRRFSPDTPFRPDYEVPVGAVVDYIFSRGDVDRDKLALYGVSLGGYFTLRATAHESRIKALISNSPVVDLYKYMTAFAGRGATDSKEDFNLSQIDGVPREYLNNGKKIQLLNIVLRYGENSMLAAFDKMKEYSLEGEDMRNIKVPFLGMVGQGEGEIALSQAREAARSVAGPSTLEIFSQPGSDSHCQMGNLPLSNSVLFDWLDGVFGLKG